MIESLPPIPLDEAWIARIRQVAPQTTTVPVQKTHRALLFSLSTGYQHWVTSRTSAMLKVLAEESDAFTVVETQDPEAFVPETLADFDGLIFNNTCSAEPKRDLFLEALGDPAKAERLRGNVIDFVVHGGAYVGIHGAILAFNNSPEWEALQGATFDHHPPQQALRLTAVEPDHPLVQAFDGKAFVHIDEPYIFRNAYTEPDFRPLLVMDRDALVPAEDKRLPEICYAAWIKRYGQGRVFYCSPSHNAQSFEKPQLLRFILDGIQYAFGDLACDDRSTI
jgi:type 1 glutamine amidotransferase